MNHFYKNLGENWFTYQELYSEIFKQAKSNSHDFIFIDAGHDYESVKKDINSWYPKLKKGGIFSDHDYNQPTCGVKKAVDEFINGNIIENNGWWIYKKI